MLASATFRVCSLTVNARTVACLLNDTFSLSLRFSPRPNCRVYIKKKPVYHPPSWESWRAASHKIEQKVPAPEKIIQANKQQQAQSSQQEQLNSNGKN